MTLPPGLFRQLWVEIFTAGAKPGTYRATVSIAAPGMPAVQVPLSIEVLPVTLPAKKPILTWSYSYQTWPLLQGRWEQAAADLADHHTNAYCWPSYMLPWPTFDAEGRLQPLDWTKFDEGLKSHRNLDSLLLWPGFEWEDNLKLRAELEIGSPLWEQRFIAWFQAMIAGLKERGFGYDRIAWYLADEPTTDRRAQEVIAAGQVIRKADPQALIVENPYGACPRRRLDQMAPVVDIWCPELSWAQGDLLKFFQDNSKILWTYQVIAKDADPFARYRLSFWDCISKGMAGQGYWCYGDCGGSNWDPYDADRDGYAVIYDGDPAELIPSKRWEAWREGVEDFTYVWTLQQKQPARAQALRARAAALVADPSPEKLAAERERVLRELARVK